MFNQQRVKLVAQLKTRFASKAEPENLRRGKLGERAAKKHLQKQGLKFLAANFRSDRGEIDLIFRAEARVASKSFGTKLIAKLLKPATHEDACLVFAEVKTRSSENWTRPAAFVNAAKQGRLTRCALDYLRLIKNPPVKIRFDVVEVLLENGAVREVRHLPNTFTLAAPYRYG